MDTHLPTTSRSARHRVQVAPAVLLLAVLAVLATGCGGSDRAGSADPAPADSSPSGPSRPADADLASAAQDAELVSVSSAGGSVDPRATVLDDRGAVAAFTRRFGGSAMAEEVERARARVDAGAGDGETIVAAVVDVSCVAPEAVEVRAGGGGVLVEAVARDAEREIECLVPVTTVAVLAVPAGAV